MYTYYFITIQKRVAKNGCVNITTRDLPQEYIILSAAIADAKKVKCEPSEIVAVMKAEERGEDCKYEVAKTISIGGNLVL